MSHVVMSLDVMFVHFISDGSSLVLLLYVVKLYCKFNCLSSEVNDHWHVWFITIKL